jgi:hypothetical protein
LLSDPYLPLLLVAAFIAGGINAVAGGGTLFTFSAMGLSFAAQGIDAPLKLANTTNAALLTPASVSSAVAFATELRASLRRLVALAIPTVFGAYAGAVVLGGTTDETFRRIVPFLVLFAVLLFAFKDQINARVRLLRGQTTPSAPTSTANALSKGAWVWGLAFQFVIAFYGGYFGAGIGILMIASFSLMGMRDMNVMNAIKNPLAFLMNGIAAVRFASVGQVRWDYAIPLAVCAVVGGYLAARASRRVNQTYLRRFVIVYGCVVAAYLLARFWFGL